MAILADFIVVADIVSCCL